MRTTLPLFVCVTLLLATVPFAAGAPDPKACAPTPAGVVDLWANCDRGIVDYTVCVYGDAPAPSTVACVDRTHSNDAECRGLYAGPAHSIHCDKEDRWCPYYQDTNVADFFVVGACNSPVGPVFAELP